MPGDQEQLGKEELIATITSTLAPLVRRNGETVSELLETMTEIKQAQMLTNERLARAVQLVESHDHILRGNGKVGLLTMVEQVEAQNREQEVHLQEILNALRGTDDKPGLVGRVSQLEVKAEGLAKPMWIILSALLGTGVTLIITNLLK